jgi:DNA-binding NtrC family response regulator
MSRILIIDDDDAVRSTLERTLRSAGHTVQAAASGEEGFELARGGAFDVVLSDLQMPGWSGLDVLRRLRAARVDSTFIILTGFGTLDTAIEALRLGAVDFLQKPFLRDELLARIRAAADRRQLARQVDLLQRRSRPDDSVDGLVGSSAAMQRVKEVIQRAASAPGTVLITGETGTGKEVVARTLYLQSQRAEMPFVPVNCGALTSTLVESQLFGHKKGAFTGADRDHKWFFEVANGGTVFLDEVGELDLGVQAKLLRFLESGEIQRLGENQPITVDVRVICATNRDLRQMVAERTFREDLLFRLNKFPLHLPPLRDRKADIPDLARHLLARAAKRPVQSIAGLLSAEALQVLMDYHWQGNVRELANAMEYAWIVSGGQPITPAHLPHDVRNPAAQPLPYPSGARETQPAYPPSGGAYTPRSPYEQAPAYPTAVPFPAQPQPAASAAPTGGTKTLADIEMEYILQVYAKNNYNKQVTATELGVSLKTLYNKLHKYEEERRQRAG